MKNFFVLLFGFVVVILMMGGCLNLEGIFPFLNEAPVMISKPIITATEDQLYLYQVEASDPNGDTLTYSFITKPEGMSINSENGLITWAPTNNQVGIHQIIVEISDSKHSVTQSFEIEVMNVNNPPQILSYSPANIDIKINEGNSVKFEVQAHDIDLNTVLSYQWLLNGKEASNSTGSGNDSKSSWIYSASYGDYSQKIVKALVSDGELQDYVQWNITINDITPPAQPTLDAVLSPTNVSPQTLSGNKGSNTSIWIYGVEVISVNSVTTWSYSYNLSEGTNNISITSRDATGNESLSITTNIILDTISPMVPTLNSIISPTNISAQILSGTKEADTSILINGAEVIPINSETTWSYSLYLNEGTNNIFITSCDTAGNESSSVSTTIVLDISTPEIPTLNDVTSLTNISSQILSGTKETNSSILINGVEVISLNSSTNWSHPYNLSEGINNISITSRDAASNESSAVTAIIILDTINPAVPTLDVVVSPTNISPQTLSGTKEANASIWINNLEVVPINPSTTWTYDFNLSEGENNISVTSQDSAGNESGKATVKIILDAISPTVPTLNEVITPTNISIQILSGSKEASSSIWLNGTEVVPLNSSTEWSYPYNLSEGINNISITSCDAVGNECAAVKNSITLDTIPPTAPTLHNIISPTNIYTQLLSGHKEINSSIWVNGVEVIPVNFETTWSYDFELIEGENSISIISKDIVGNESNEINTTVILDISAPRIPSLGHIISQTNISSQILSGTKEANSSIWINGVEVISVNSVTTWSYSYNLSEGINNISITSRDAASNESSVVTAIIILDTINPAVPTLDAVVFSTNVSPQILSGTKETNTSIWINEIESVLINSDTTWSHIFDLSEGANKISITACDAAGNKSTTVTANITLDTVVPETPNLNPATSPTNISSQTLSGTKEANSSILINDTEVVSINSSTDWSHPYNLSEGINNISITSRDAAGNESSEVLTTIEYDPNIYVDIGNISGIEDGTQTHPFNSIIEGIEAVTSGKSVVVAAGTYNEQLIINKGIDLRGAGKESAFIIGFGYTGNLITVTADDVTISGFIIDGKSRTDVGIYSDSSSSIEISENVIQNHQDSGILYHRTSDDYTSGIYVYNNEICQNSQNGIKVTGAGSGIIEGNIIRNSDYGIKASNDASLEVKKNNIYNNYDSGIFCRNNSSLLIWGNEITSNGYGIRVGEQYSDTTNPDIGGGAKSGIGKNNLVGNTTPKGVSNMTDHNIYAKYNWWGDAAGPKYPNNPDGNASLSSDWAYWDNVNNKTGAIIFEDYLTEPQIF